MTPRFLVSRLCWRSQPGEVRGATKAGKRSESFLISSGHKTDAATRTSVGFHLPGGACGAPQQPPSAEPTAHLGPFLQKRRRPPANTQCIDRQTTQGRWKLNDLAWIICSRTSWGTSWWVLSASGLTHLARNHNRYCKKKRHLATPPIKNFNCLK